MHYCNMLIIQEMKEQYLKEINTMIGPYPISEPNIVNESENVRREKVEN